MSTKGQKKPPSVATLKRELAKARKEAAAAQASLESYRRVIDEHAIVVAMDADGVITTANDKACEVSGYSREELIGTHYQAHLSDHYTKDFYKELYATLSKGESWYGEFKNIGKDGRVYWVDSTTIPVRDADGNITEYYAVRTDITDRKSAEEQARTHAELMQAMFDGFPGGIGVFTADMELTTANPAFYRLLGLSEEDFPPGSKCADIIQYNAERGEYGEGSLEELMRSRVGMVKSLEPYTFRQKRENGRSLDVKGWPLPQGGFIMTYQDVTAMENMMAAIEEASNEAISTAEELRQTRDIQNQTHQRLVTSVNSMRNGFAIWDADDRLVLANEAYRGFLDPIREQIVDGMKFEDLMSASFDAGIWEVSDVDKETWINRQVALRRETEELSREVTLADGRQLVFEQRVLGNGDVIATVIDVTAHRQRELELKDTKQQLERIAYFDNLTGLANRAHCQKDLVDKFAFASTDSRFALIQIDLDNFKRVNDTQGHAAGDHLLQVLGQRLRLFAKHFENFKAYRWGGDEFIALVERDDKTNLSAMCEELNDLIAIPLKFEKATLRPTVSLGVARYPEDAPDLEALMIFADLALYKTKELGRDGYQFFTAEMKEKVDAESRIEQELRVAIEEDQLELFFQPQVNIKDETITGLEALLRWRHPERGLVSPSGFLPVVEETGLAPAVGRQVFDKAMRAVRRWQDEGIAFGRLAVNLSPNHLKQGTVLDDYFAAMEKYGITPDVLAVEFLESLLFDDPHADTANALDQLRARGIHVELDDFGTGYASLSHLSTMPINGLKIDQSFVCTMLENTKQQGIVSSLISMSKLMELHVVCEGVETKQQADAIAEIGNCSIQGYFVARPMSFDDTTDWIRSGANKGILQSLPDTPVALSGL